jgi:diguanylate cyclase (GGDEF)-like protein
MGRIADMKTSLARANEQLNKLATIDGLTAIRNRRAFDSEFDRLNRQAARDGTLLSLLFIDIDLFKAFNDGFGHVEGDVCLKRFATILEDSLKRPIDIAFRYGGEEFAVLLPHTGKEGAERTATRILENLAEGNIPHQFSNVANHVTASIGIAVSPNGEAKYLDLIATADNALYEAKQAGRNCIKVAKESL